MTVYHKGNKGAMVTGGGKDLEGRESKRRCRVLRLVVNLLALYGQQYSNSRQGGGWVQDINTSIFWYICAGLQKEAESRTTEAKIWRG